MKFLKQLIYAYRLKQLQTHFKNNQLGKEAIIISGSPRGGTTWVFEVLQKSSSVFGVWEPLHPEKQLETWKKNLKDEQAKRVRVILSKFGFNHIGDVDYSLELNREIVL